MKTRDRFTSQLAESETAIRANLGDPLYHMQAELIRGVLDIADEAIGEPAAARLADALAERWAGDVAATANARAEAMRIQSQAAAMFPLVNLEPSVRPRSCPSCRSILIDGKGCADSWHAMAGRQ